MLQKEAAGGNHWILFVWAILNIQSGEKNMSLGLVHLDIE